MTVVLTQVFSRLNKTGGKKAHLSLWIDSWQLMDTEPGDAWGCQFSYVICPFLFRSSAVCETRSTALTCVKSAVNIKVGLIDIDIDLFFLSWKENSFFSI